MSRSPRARARSSILITAVAAAGLATAAPASAAPAAPAAPSAVTQVVYVQTTTDGDRDGRPDRVRTEIIRPDGTARVPVIIQASPYYASGRPGSTGTLASTFVPRGYAVAYVDLPGTAGSTGCDDVGGDLEVQGAKSVIDWLNARANAYTSSTGSTAVSASWSTGKAAMIGVSWNGTIANGVASTGVDGLRTIVPIAAISSWYDYTRGQGVPFYKGHVAYLHDYVSNYNSATCQNLTSTLGTASDDPTGNYNTWWKSRNYHALVSNFKASVLVVHGLNDENVKTDHFGRLWDALAARGVPRKLFLHQGAHVDGFNYGSQYTSILIPWMEHWLKDVQNGIMDTPMARVQREDKTWRDDAVWPVAGTNPVTFAMGAPGTSSAGSLIPGGAPRTGTVSITAQNATSSDTDASSPNTPKANRAAFVTAPLAGDVRTTGTSTVTVKVKSSRSVAGLRARLVNYSGSGTTVFARTVASVGHAQSLEQRVSLDPNTWYTLTFRVNTEDYLFRSGSTIGLVLSPETGNPTLSWAPTTLTLDMSGSKLVMPVSGSLTSARGAGALDGPLVSQEPRATLADQLREMREVSSRR